MFDSETMREVEKPDDARQVHTARLCGSAVGFTRPEVTQRVQMDGRLVATWLKRGRAAPRV